MVGLRRMEGASLLVCGVGMSVLSALLAMSASVPADAQASTAKVEIEKSSQLFGGRPAITIKRARTGDGTKPEILSVTVLPGRSMQILRVTADVPGLGEQSLLEGPSIEAAAAIHALTDDKYGYKAFHMGAPFLIPFANRMVGDFPSTETPVTVRWDDKTLHLIPSNHTKGPDVHYVSIHGMFNYRAAAQVTEHTTKDGGTVEALFHCGDFEGHWPSKTDVTISVSLSGGGVMIDVHAKNVGDEKEPMSIGSHPFIRILGGDRTKIRIHVPAASHAEASTDGNTLPTGVVKPVEGTEWDFRAADGVAIGGRALDDSFTDVHWDAAGAAATLMIDPVAHLGLRVASLSKDVSSIQVYAPTTRDVVAIEDQFNLNDPFGPEWKGRPTGMVVLKPGQSTEWKQSLQLFAVK